ncbi:MAG: ABC transporter permease [Planctomycetaceae bacterium]
MSGLWRKELRSAYPFLGLVISLFVLDLVLRMWTELPNAMPMAETYKNYVASGVESTIVCFVLVFAMASGLLVREYDEGTMEFLDSLPVSRSRVFAVKVTMALLTVILLIVLDMGTGVLLHALSRNSLDRSFHLSLLATGFGLRTCQLFVVLSLGLALSFLRRFGWLVLGLLFWSFIFLREWVPSIAVFDLVALTEPNFEGDRWIVPRRLLEVQLSLGFGLLTIAYGLFLGLGDRLWNGYQRLTRTRLGNACLWSASVVLVIAVASLAFRFADQEFAETEADDNGVTIVYPSWSTSRSRTAHFEFMYPTNLSNRALALIDAADSVHEKVTRFLDTEAGAPIVVDATSALPRHAGLAYWDKIRLDLTVTEHQETLQSILGHEATHVFLERLSDSRLTDHFNSTRFFHEGVASYVEFHLFEPREGVDPLRSVAAVMHARKEVKIEEMVNSHLLTTRRDTDLVYPLGEVFVEALVDRYGEAAIGNIVRQLTRDDAPKDLTGLELWRDIFQACDYSFDELLNDFFARLDREVERHRALVDHLPRLRGVVTSNDDWVIVQVQWKHIDGWNTTCRFRQSQDTPKKRYLHGMSNEQDVFYQDRGAFPEATLWFQLGLSDGQGRVIYEPWLQIRLE